MGPIPHSERLEVVDVLRGAALFGIITANMRAFNSPAATYMDHTLMWTGTPDRIAQGLVDLLVMGKFITLFSFLFGIGFAVQMDRAQARGVAPRTFYRRRLAVLLVMGLAHMFLVWWGDILTAYALMGFILLLFRKRSQKTVLTWAVLLYAWPLLFGGVFALLIASGVNVPMPRKPTAAELARTVQIYAAGTYGQMLQARLKDAFFNLGGLFVFYPRCLGLFLLGLWTWRAGMVQDSSEASLRRLRRWGKWGLWIGLIGNGAVVAIQEIYHPDPFSFGGLGYPLAIVGSIAVPALSLFYATTIALASRRADWQPRLCPLAAVGRTALTNYLLQTAICTTLYDSWGFGLYGRVGPLVGLAPTIIIYAAQVQVSAWWTSRFAFGPMEWLWRRLTYGRAL